MLSIIYTLNKIYIIYLCNLKVPPIGNWRVVPKPANYQLAARFEYANYQLATRPHDVTSLNIIIK